MNSFKKFMDKLICLNWKSIQLSREVLDKRKQLEILSDQLIEQIDFGVREMEGLCKTLKQLEELKEKIKDSENYEYEEEVPYIVHRPVPNGHYTTTCKDCQINCHKNCAYADDKDKYKCWAMTNGICRICKHNWQIHYNYGYFIERKTKIEKKIYENTKKINEQGKIELVSYEENKKKNIEKFKEIQFGTLLKIENMKIINEELKMIALNKYSYISTEQYIDILIKRLEYELQSNPLKENQKKLNGLKKLKKLYQNIKDAYILNEQRGIEEFEEYKRVNLYKLDNNLSQELSADNLILDLEETRYIKNENNESFFDDEEDFKKLFIDKELIDSKKEYLKKKEFYMNKKDNLFLNENNKNNIICIYKISNINQLIQILNSYEELKKSKSYCNINGIQNEKELKEKSIIYRNEEYINFCYQCKFQKKGENVIKIIFKKQINQSNYMFFKCDSLKSLDLSNFISDNISNMRCMFYRCNSLTSLNLSNFNTNNVTDMNGMFYNCSSLTSLNLSNFKTNNVSNMSEMFSDCYSLTSLNLSNFKTNKVTHMNGMFSGCSSLVSLNLSNFITNNVINMSEMFNGCSSLTSLNLSNFKTNNVSNMSYMFYNCSLLTFLNLSNFKTNNDTKIMSIFDNLKKSCKIILNDIRLKKEYNPKKK